MNIKTEMKKYFSHVFVIECVNLPFRVFTNSLGKVKKV